jgi:hypothetical protein
MYTLIRLLYSSALIALMVSSVQAQDLPIYTCLQTATPPLIDGDGTDAVWTLAADAQLFDVEDLERQTRHSRPTRVKMLWDADNLYFLFNLEDVDVWSTFTDRDDQLWQEEVVEIFIDPDGDGLNYAEIEVNPLNVIFDLLLSQPWADGGRGFAEWNPQFSSAVQIDGTLNDPDDTDRGWTVELALPWAALATDIRDVANGMTLPPQAGDQWRINLYRFERIRENGAVVSSQASAWSTVGVEDFHRPDRFGFMSFTTGATAVEASAWGKVKNGE